MRCCFITLGCRVNQYESDAMAELLTQAGFEITENPAEADVCIVNTCTVTNIADRKSRQMLSKAHKLNPNAKLIAAGCFAQRSPEAAAKLEGVYAVLGSADKNRVVELVKSIAEGRENEPKSEKCNCGEKELCDCCGGMKKFEQPENSECSGNAAGGAKILVRDVMHEHEFEEMSAVHEGRTRAYLKIQDGCNMFCTYCAIPYARGGLRSRSIESVRAEAEKLNNEGFSEVVLTGIHLMSYGRDLRSGTDIRDAVRCFDGLDNIKRIRFGSLEPHMMTDEIIAELADNKRICRQFHLSLQSGSDTVLERMRRGYTSGQYFELCQKLRISRKQDSLFPIKETTASRCMTRCLNYLDTASPQLKHHPLLQRKTFWHLLYPPDIRRATVIHIVSSHISQKFHIICDAIIIYRFKTILIFFVNIYLFKLSSSSDMIRMSMCQHYIIGKRSQPGNQLFQVCHSDTRIDE